jgi:hypothetical protein
MAVKATVVAVIALALGTAGPAFASEGLSQDEEIVEEFLYELQPCGRSSSPTTSSVKRLATTSAGTYDATYECADAGKRCFVGQWSKRRDYFPYRRWVYQRTRWCSRNGWVVSTTTTDWARSDLGCAVIWGPETRRTGLNSSIVHLVTSAQFSCNLYITHLTDWVELRVAVTWNGKAYKS